MEPDTGVVKIEREECITSTFGDHGFLEIVKK